MAGEHNDLDARILEFIAKGSSTFAPIDRPAWLTIQSRLQVLRKDGKIEYTDGLWQIVKGEK